MRGRRANAGLTWAYVVDREHFGGRQPQVLSDGELGRGDALLLRLVVRQPLQRWAKQGYTIALPLFHETAAAASS
jgi:hypothetical protein